jgi:hypothetical protein
VTKRVASTRFWFVRSWRVGAALLLLIATAGPLTSSLLNPPTALIESSRLAAATTPRGVLWCFVVTQPTTAMKVAAASRVPAQGFGIPGAAIAATFNPTVLQVGPGNKSMAPRPMTFWKVPGIVTPSGVVVLPGGVSVYVSLWWATGISLLPAAWFLWSAWRHRPQTACCTQCGYTREGLAPEAACPECGSVAFQLRRELC